jgi:hypothetical protein
MNFNEKNETKNIFLLQVCTENAPFKLADSKERFISRIGNFSSLKPR